MGAHFESEIFSTDAAVKLIVTATERDTCDQKIIPVKCNVVFLIKFNSELERLDLRRDGMGSWVCGHRNKLESFSSTTYQRSATGDMSVRRVVYTNRSAPDLKRTEIHIVSQFYMHY